MKTFYQFLVVALLTIAVVPFIIFFQKFFLAATNVVTITAIVPANGSNGGTPGSSGSGGISYVAISGNQPAPASIFQPVVQPPPGAPPENNNINITPLFHSGKENFVPSAPSNVSRANEYRG